MDKEKPTKRPLTRDYLVRATYNYLQRFATTQKNLRAVLERKVHRRLPLNDGQAEFDQAKILAKTWIDEIVKMAAQQNLVNDRQFAAARARALHRSGNSTSRISQKLLAKGVPAALVTDVMAEMAEQNEHLDRLAAIKYIKKRRFGAFARINGREKSEEKQIAALCRAGFSYGLGQEILKKSRDELEEMLYKKPDD